MARRTPHHLPPEVTRIVYVRNLPYRINAEELYDIFGKYGAIRQIRRGVAEDTRGTAFVVYEDVFDAKNAVDNLSGFNVAGRYLVVLYFNPMKRQRKLEELKAKEELYEIRKKLGIAQDDFLAPPVD